MDKTDGGKTGPCSHLETTASIKRRHGLESCDLTVRSLAEARLGFEKCCTFTMELRSKVSRGLCP